MRWPVASERPPVIRPSAMGGIRAATASTSESGSQRVQAKSGCRRINPTLKGWTTKAKRCTSPAAVAGRDRSGLGATGAAAGVDGGA